MRDSWEIRFEWIQTVLQWVALTIGVALTILQLGIQPSNRCSTTSGNDVIRQIWSWIDYWWWIRNRWHLWRRSWLIRWYRRWLVRFDLRRLDRWLVWRNGKRIVVGIPWHN